MIKATLLFALVVGIMGAYYFVWKKVGQVRIELIRIMIRALMLAIPFCPVPFVGHGIVVLPGFYVLFIWSLGNWNPRRHDIGQALLYFSGAVGITWVLFLVLGVVLSLWRKGLILQTAGQKNGA